MNCNIICTYYSIFFVASSIVAETCETGNVRLFNFSDNINEATRQGRLEICINNVWGVICSDNLFDTRDAEVFCGQLDGFTSQGESLLYFIDYQ